MKNQTLDTSHEVHKLNLIKLDLSLSDTILRTMQRVLKSEAIQSALADHGLTQKQLAENVGVSSQAVTNWLKGKDFPRPATLLKIATALKLNFDQMVQTSDTGQPVIAFRKKAMKFFFKGYS